VGSLRLVGSAGRSASRNVEAGGFVQWSWFDDHAGIARCRPKDESATVDVLACSFRPAVGNRR
jgi:hypothetical protein